jgi:hypothetical protein
VRADEEVVDAVLLKIATAHLEPAAGRQPVGWLVSVLAVVVLVVAA